MFKKGDKVKCICQTSMNLEEGQIYTVKESKLNTVELIYVEELDDIIPHSARSFKKCSD